ncbi:MAG: PTS sugar transporter subunit IIA [Rhodospirillales bacterium]|nr:PTS sugar transporter subunit IIA [Rhodospirillales bacterium]
MTLETLIPPERVFHDLRAADKPRLLQELARRAGAALGVPAGDIAAALATREALGSTGVGAGIAVPHAQLPQLDATAGFLARLERPVDYASVDGRPVDLLFLLIGPPAARAEHLAALAAATRRLRDPAIADALRSAPGAEALRVSFLAVPNNK